MLPMRVYTFLCECGAELQVFGYGHVCAECGRMLVGDSMEDPMDELSGCSLEQCWQMQFMDSVVFALHRAQSVCHFNFLMALDPNDKLSRMYAALSDFMKAHPRTQTLEFFGPHSITSWWPAMRARNLRTYTAVAFLFVGRASTVVELCSLNICGADDIRIPIGDGSMEIMVRRIRL